jgi:drug/metabolite transporter (DMT)-like permease
MDFGALNAVVFGLLSSAVWGAGDFSGGLASKKGQLVSVLFIMEVVGGLMLLALALLTNQTVPPLGDWLGGGVAGIFGLMGVAALYWSLANGRMGLAAPVAGVVGAGVPVIFSLFTQGLPTASKLLGFALGLLSVWLVSQTETGRVRPRDLVLPALAGLGFGLFFILISQYRQVSVIYPVVAARIAQIGILLIFILGSRGRFAFVPARAALPLTVVAGVFDALGNLFFVLAEVYGALAVASVLSSLYPTVTVLLAALVLKEQVGTSQRFGIGLALLAIVFIAV